MSKPSGKYVRSQLVNYTNADTSESEVKNSRYHYLLTFEQSVGWDWVYQQVMKCGDAVGLSVEPYKLRPSEEGAYTVEVREVKRRKNIDENQRGLTEFEG